MKNKHVRPYASLAAVSGLLLAGLLPGLPAEGARLHPKKARPFVLQAHSLVSGDSVTFSPDGQQIAAGYSDDQVAVWDWRAHRLRWQRSLHGEGGGDIAALAFSPNGRTVAFGQENGSWDCDVLLFRTRTGRRLRRLQGLGYPVEAIAFSPDGRTVAGGSWEDTENNKRYGKVILWDRATGRRKRALMWPGGGGSAVTFSPDGRLLECGGDNTLLLWDVRLRCHGRLFQYPASQGTAAAFSPDGRMLAMDTGIGPAASGIGLWTVRPGRVRRRLRIPGRWVRSLAFSPGGRVLASGDRDGRIFLWDLRTGALRRTLSQPGIIVRSLAISPNGRLLASAGDDGKIRIWHL